MSLATLCGPWCRYWLADLFVAAVVIGAVLLLRRLGIAYSNRVQAIVQNAGVAVALLIAITVGFYAVTIAPPLLKHDTANAAQLIALGLLSVGAVIGFLFGLPKVADDSASTTTTTSTTPANGSAAAPASGSATSARLHVNTNLQKVSDWLTTVITGLALTQLLDVPTHIKDLASYLGGGLVEQTHPMAYTGSLLEWSCTSRPSGFYSAILRLGPFSRGPLMKSIALSPSRPTNE